MSIFQNMFIWCGGAVFLIAALSILLQINSKAIDFIMLFFYGMMIISVFGMIFSVTV